MMLAAWCTVACSRRVGNACPVCVYARQAPTFGVPDTAAQATGTASTRSLTGHHKRVLCAWAQQLGIQFCPMLHHLAVMLLHCLTEAQAFAVGEALLGSSREIFLLRSVEQEAAFVKTFQVRVRCQGLLWLRASSPCRERHATTRI